MAEEALGQRNNFSPLRLAAVVAFFLYIGVFMRIPILPLFAKSLGASTLEVGLITSLFMVIAAVLAIPLGSLSDRLGRRRLIVFGLTLSSATSFLLFFTKTPGQIMAVYALAGLGVASFAPAMASFLGDVTRRSRMARAYGWYTTAMQIGMAAGPAIGGFTAEKADYAVTFLVSGAVISLPLLVALLFLPNIGEPEPRASLNHISKSIAVLRENRGVQACWLAVFSIAFSFGAFMPFFPLYAREIGLTAASIGLLFTVQSLFNAVARIPAGYLSDRLGTREPFVMVGMLIFGASIAFLIFSTSVYMLTVFVSLMGLAMGVTTMALSTSLAESVKRVNRGVAMGGFSTALYGGFAISAAATGWIISIGGYVYGFLSAGMICVLGAGIFYLMRRTRLRN